MDVVGHGVGIDFARAAFLCADAACEIAKMVNRQRDVGVERFAYRFAIVHGFDVGEQLQIRLEAIRDFEQNI